MAMTMSPCLVFICIACNSVSKSSSILCDMLSLIDIDVPAPCAVLLYVV